MNKKNIKSSIIVVLSIIVFFIVFSVVINLFDINKKHYQEPSYSLDYDNGFYVENFKVEILGKKDRTFEITEEIQVNFIKERSVLLRDIPVNSGEKVRDLKVDNNEYLSSYFENGFYTVEMGREYPKYTGSKTFKLSYTLITPIMYEFEESLFLNVIGCGWPKIENVEVKLNFPTEKLLSREYSQGRQGTNQGNYIITEEGNGITIRNKAVYNPNEGLTVRFNYEEGFLTEYSTYFGFIIAIIYSIIAILGSMILYWIFGTEDDPVEVVNFEAPMNMTPAEMGFLIDNSCSREDVVSLFFTFAAKGYLKIIEKDDKFSFEKLRDIENNTDFSSHEKALFNTVFKAGTLVELDSLTYKLANQVENVRASIGKKHSGKLYNSKSMGLSVGVLILMMALFFGINYLLGTAISSQYFNFSGIFGIVGFIIAYGFGLALIYNKYKFQKRMVYFAKLGLILIMSFIAVFYIISLNSQTLSIIDGIILASSSIIASLIIPSLINRTPYYNDLLGNILGFKNFLETAEKDKIEAMIAENPNYYYDILPYAQVLGVSDIWTEKFSNLTLTPPTYYYSNRIGLFDIYLYNRFYRNATATFKTMTMPKPSSNSSSGFRGGGGFGGGGGFTGGGFGGGGGRSR